MKYEMFFSARKDRDAILLDMFAVDWDNYGYWEGGTKKVWLLVRGIKALK